MKEKRIRDFVKRKKLLTKNMIGIVLFLISILTVILVSFFIKSKEVNNSVTVGPENLRAMNYEQFVDGDDKVFVAGTEGTDNEEVVDNIKFSTFFLRDLDSDGYAEKLKGTCKEIGKEDTLYMEIIVQTSGYLKNGKIEIDGKNFYLQTALPKDNELKENYIGSNIKNIEFENLNNGTQKILTGIVRSGDYTYASKKTEAIGNNINNYSRKDNKVILTGTYVEENGAEHEIRKEIILEMDWYGTTKTIVNELKQNYYNLDDSVNEDSRQIELKFTIRTYETDEKLLVFKNHVEVDIPKLNGYNPINVTVENSNVEYSYSEETSKLIIERTAVTDASGKITSSVARNNIYDISIKYPLDAYEEYGRDTVELLIPVEEYYEGYNNPNSEFENPYMSNIEKTVIRAIYNNSPIIGTEPVDNVLIRIGEYIKEPYKNYVISKSKPMRIYNGISSEETDDTYIVNWRYYKSSSNSEEKIILKETPNGESQYSDQYLTSSSQYLSMDELVSNKGIYFDNLRSVLSDNGEIKVYDDETGNLLLTVDNTKINEYTINNPFMYETSIKHIRVEVNGMNYNSAITVYNIKELDDDYITSNYSLEEFSELKQIKSNLVVYKGDTLVGNKSNNALYEIPTSIATINLNKNTISTQVTEKNEIISITAEDYEYKNETGWTNGIFLVKIPDEIISTEINSVSVNNDEVEISSYEYYENTQGKFIKIYTQNEKPVGYIITIDCNLTPDPRIASVYKNVELIGINNEATDYYYKTQDIYDINGNFNTDEIINKTITGISLISPNSLLTSQIATEFDESGTIIVSPNIVELKPIYGDDDREKQSVKIGVHMRNNYSSTISEVKILGKIPFEGNTFVLSGNDLKSDFSTTMTNDGIEVPEELQDKVTIYYSENENPDKDLNKEENGWMLKTNVTDWSKIKTFLIDFEDTVIGKEKEYIFYYTIEIPFGIDFNKIAYSHHGIYFSLDTPEGKYRTKVEPNKIGIRIAEKYNLFLTKYQKNVEKTVKGAKYKISKLNENNEIEESNTAITNSNGMLEMDNLYAEKEYIIEEIESPENYKLNGDRIRIIGHINRNTSELTVQKLEGTIKGNIEIVKNDGEDYKLKVNVEDEVKAKLHITKLEEGNDTRLKKVKFKITGGDFPDGGKILTTDINGEININNLNIDEEYSLEEVEAKGYYLGNPVKFKIINSLGIYEVVITEGEVKSSDISIVDDIPTANLELENEKIPTYNLIINKVEKGSITEENPVGIPIVGAKFRLYKENKAVGSYITDSEGHITINGLYQYEEEKDIDQTYTLKELYAPEGYAKARNLVYMVSNISNELDFNETIEEGQKLREYRIDGTNVIVTIEDSPSFKLIKKDGETNELLPNTKFAVYSVDEEEIPAKNSKGEIIGTKENIYGIDYYTLTTNENGEITEDLPEGLYKVVEVDANEKYDITDNVKYFGIGKEQETTGTYSMDWNIKLSLDGDKIISTSDGNYVALIRDPSGSFNLMKFKGNGDIIWNKTIGTSNSS